MNTTDTITMDVEKAKKATNLASKEVSERVSSDVWRMIEKVPDAITKTVLISLTSDALNVIKNTIHTAETSNKISSAYVLSEKYYIGNIRNVFAKHGLFAVANTDDTKETTLAKEKGKKPIVKKADAIRAQNTTLKLQKVLDVIKYYGFEQKSDKQLLSDAEHGFKSEYIEIIGITFIYMARYYIFHKNKFGKSKYINKVLSLMVSMQRYINACNNFIGIDPVDPRLTSEISRTFLEDIKKCYTEMNVTFPFNGMDVCLKAPELLVHAPLDQYVSTTAIQPRTHQREIVRKVYNNLSTGFFIVYNAMINTGKTTTVISLAEIAKFYGKQLLCVCNMDTVRIQMANMCCSNGTKFAMGYIRPDDTVKISYHYHTLPENCTVIICGAKVAYQLLTQRTEDGSDPAEKYILFHDEPTIGADIEDSEPLRENVNVLVNAPKWVIFSSATSPTFVELEPLISSLRNKYPDMVVDKVYSPTVQVGCEIRTFEGDMVVPYIGCKNSSDILQVVQKINDIPFIGRTLTPNVALYLYGELCSYKKEDGFVFENIPDLPSMFKQVENMKTDKIREIVIMMLELLSTAPDDIIEKICGSTITKIKQNETHEEDTETYTKKNNKGIDCMSLGTTEQWKCMTLVASENPYLFARTNFKSLLDELNENGIKSSTMIIDLFEKEFELWEIEKEKKKRKIEASISKGNSTMTEYERGVAEQTIDETGRPTVKFPDWGQVGTIEHYAKFNKIAEYNNVSEYRLANDLEQLVCRKKPQSEAKKRINKTEKLAKQERVTETEKEQIVNMMIPDDLMLLLLCGIGIYSPCSDYVNKIYTEVVMEYASNGKLAYVIADESIAFGTNFPFGRVVITKHFAQKHSIATLFQLMGRAGRVGKLAKADAYVDKETAISLIDYAIHPEKYAIEAVNISKMIVQLEKIKNKRLNEDIALLEAVLFNGTLDKIDDTIQIPTQILIKKHSDENIVNETINKDTENIVAIEQPDTVQETCEDDIPDSWEDYEPEIPVKEPEMPVKEPVKTSKYVPPKSSNNNGRRY
jgi:hypothetical protein